MPEPMTISKELFYSDEMVAKRYGQLSDEYKDRFNQMQDLVKAIKRDMGEYMLIEDIMAQWLPKDTVNGQRHYRFSNGKGGRRH